MSVSQFYLDTREDIETYVSDLIAHGKLDDAEQHLSKVIDAPEGELARYFLGLVQIARQARAPD